MAKTNFVYVIISTLLVFTTLIFVSPVKAHFNLNVNIRIIHVYFDSGNTYVLMRIPMSYLVADKVGEKDSTGKLKPAPFTTNQIENGQLMHYLDPLALQKNPQGLGEILANNLLIVSDGKLLEPMVGRVKAYSALRQPPFSSLQEAKTSFLGAVVADNYVANYVGDTLIDVELIFDSEQPLNDYTIAIALNPGLDKQNEVANLILDHNGDSPLIYRITGLLNEPTAIRKSSIKALLTFVNAGFVHIFKGYDHVLFIICLTLLTLTSIQTLLWSVTGFTIGHSITLALGFFGFIPSAVWFIPLIEILIALSIVYVAFLIVIPKQNSSSIIMTSSIGLLHGLGFAFVLQKILFLDSQNIWQSLLGFNIGIEIGQIIIAVIVWSSLYFVAKKNQTFAKGLKLVIAYVCIGIASFWGGERALFFLG